LSSLSQGQIFNSTRKGCQDAVSSSLCPLFFSALSSVWRALSIAREEEIRESGQHHYGQHIFTIFNLILSMCNVSAQQVAMLWTLWKLVYTNKKKNKIKIYIGTQISKGYEIECSSDWISCRIPARKQLWWNQNWDLKDICTSRNSFLYPVYQSI